MSGPEPSVPAQPVVVPSPPGVQPPGMPPPAVPPVVGKPRNRRVRLWVAMGLGIVVLLCLGGVGVFVSLYDSATSIKRSDPDAVADSFLRAYLVERDDKQASLFTCKSGSDLAALSTLRTQLVNREKEFNVKVVVTWGSLAVTGTGDTHRDVQADLMIAGTTNGQTQSSHTEPWKLGLIDDDGWRVCNASKVA